MEIPSSIGQFLTFSPITGGNLPDRITPAPATIYFEVAPDPSNLSLAADWRALSIESRHEISRRISALVTPGVLRALQSHGQQLQGWGGYEGETNPSLAIRLSDAERAMEVAAALRYVFSQESVMLTSDACRVRLAPVDLITIQLPSSFAAANISGLYDWLWELQIQGKRVITGHTTFNSEMRILNRSGLDTRKLRVMIDSHLLGVYSVSISTTSATFVEKPSYGDGIHSPEFAAPQCPLYLERLRDLRRAAQLMLRDMLEREKLDYSSPLESREAA